jgi:hypothetical protein
VKAVGDCRRQGSETKQVNESNINSRLISVNKALDEWPSINKITVAIGAFQR